MTIKPLTRGAICVTLCFLAFAVPRVSQSVVCDPVVGKLSSVEGRVEVQRDASATWINAKLGTELCRRDTIRVSRSSRAAISLVNDAVVRIDEGTTLRLLSISQEVEKPSLLDLVRGAIQSFSRKPRLMRVNTPYLNGTIEGTEFLVRVAGSAATITVLEGRVRAENSAGAVLVAAGQEAHSDVNGPPALRTLVKPRDAVQWTLYYPPILVASETGNFPLSREPSQTLTRALNLLREGNPGAALKALDDVPNTDRGGPYYLNRAAIALSVGRAESASKDLAKAIEHEPKLGEAYALRSVIHLVQNRRAEALADAKRAVELSDSSATRIALSYAQQAAFELEAARDSLMLAAARSEPDALVWARLGELQLMLGDREGALASAQRAAELAPQLGRTELVRGFAALSLNRLEAAQNAFTRAVNRSAADPLAHLGLGLAEIAAGNLAKGRGQLELAVALDSNSALLRAYLGKAYFGEKRSPLAGQQYELAKQLDPRDPTAYLYSAILHQTTNRPVDALYDLAASIERNDNRAVYRSRLLLDKDRAARGTSLARIYQDLDFDAVGVNEATRSLTTDPSNASAHRFLSDSYRGVQRRETARVSELLQAQMFQDINVNPVQPSVASTNLNIVTAGGPSQAGFNEFTPLFEHDGAQGAVNAFFGSNSTRGGEGVISGVFGNVSLSAGGFSFETDGFRDNNDLRHTIVDLYAQAAVSPSLNLQVEFRHRQTDHGDIDLNFSPDDFRPAFRDGNETNTQRAGLRFSPTQRTSVLVSAIHSDVERNQSDRTVLPPTGEITRAEVTNTLSADDDAKQFEVLLVHSGTGFDLTAGAAYAQVKREGRLRSVLDFTLDPAPRTFCASIFPPNPTVEVPNGTPVCVAFPFLVGPIVVDVPPLDDSVQQNFPLDLTTDDYRGYGYATFGVGSSVDATLGVSRTDYENEFIDFDRWNPKLGARWRPVSGVELR
ncbi:MAG: tetratricopeptide (TPR) repeat protein, partial [Gammaproteobacteria bacterium]